MNTVEKLLLEFVKKLDDKQLVDEYEFHLTCESSSANDTMSRFLIEEAIVRGIDLGIQK